jgi:hypothetical protein
MKAGDAIRAVASVLSQMTQSERNSLAAMLEDKRIGEDKLRGLVRELATKSVARQVKSSGGVMQQIDEMISGLRAAGR